MLGECSLYALIAVTIPVSYVALIYAFDGRNNARDHPSSVRKRFAAVIFNNILSITGTFFLLYGVLII